MMPSFPRLLYRTPAVVSSELWLSLRAVNCYNCSACAKHISVGEGPQIAAA